MVTKRTKQVERQPIIRAILLAVCFTVLFGIRMHVNNSITGDEPHYLLMDYSLVHDKDLNLKNNYQNNDSRGFYPGLSAHQQVGLGQGTENSSRWYSIHGIGLPVVLFLGFIVAAKTGAVIVMLLLATGVVWLCESWAYEVTRNRTLSYLAALALLSMYSFNGLATSIQIL